MKVKLLSITPNAEKLIELSGRMCRKSIDKMTENSSKSFIQMIIKSGHESVLEHASATFKISGISRACSHQLVRHRLCSFSQVSQRWVDGNNFGYVIPKSISTNKEANKVFRFLMEKIKITYQYLIDLKIPKEDARFILVNATETDLIVTANFREWRWIFGVRTSKKAQWEIREMSNKILNILIKNAPVVFGDLIKKEKRL